MEQEFASEDWEEVKLGDCKLSALVLRIDTETDTQECIPLGTCRLNDHVYRKVQSESNSKVERVPFRECRLEDVLYIKKQKKTEVWSLAELGKCQAEDIVFYKQAASGFWCSEKLGNCRASGYILKRDHGSEDWVETKFGDCSAGEIVLRMRPSN